MKQDFLLIVAIVAILLASINFFVVFQRINDFNAAITGFSTEYGKINLTVISALNINFSVNTINFTNGSVGIGEDNASLISAQTSATRGTWDWSGLGEQYLRLDNIGNVNASLNISAGKTAAAFLGGASGQLYMWNISNWPGEETACDGGDAGGISAYNLTATGDGSNICTVFQKIGSGNNTIRIDILLHVPNDASPGEKQDTITATAWT